MGGRAKRPVRESDITENTGEIRNVHIVNSVVSGAKTPNRLNASHVAHEVFLRAIPLPHGRTALDTLRELDLDSRDSSSSGM